MHTKFKAGDRVRVRAGDPQHHFRTPAYIQEKIGVIAAVHGEFRNPESLAYGADGLPKQPLYLVSFAQGDIWGQHSAAPHDRLFIDIYENWLEATED